MFRHLIANVVLASVLALAAAIPGCKDSATAKADIQVAGSAVNAVANTPACEWLSAASNDPEAGTICKDVLDLLGGGLTVAGQLAAHKPVARSGPIAYKEVRASGRLVGVLRPDAAAELVKQLAAKGVSAVVSP
jgi:hypothetical protein